MVNYWSGIKARVFALLMSIADVEELWVLNWSEPGSIVEALLCVYSKSQLRWVIPRVSLSKQGNRQRERCHNVVGKSNTQTQRVSHWSEPNFPRLTRIFARCEAVPAGRQERTAPWVYRQTTARGRTRVLTRDVQI